MRFLFALCSLVLRVSAPCPRCTDTDPVTAGSYSLVEPHTFQPTQNCYLAVPEGPEIFELLAGSWLSEMGACTILIKLDTASTNISVDTEITKMHS